MPDYFGRMIDHEAGAPEKPAANGHKEPAATAVAAAQAPAKAAPAKAPPAERTTPPGRA
jgi:hypothetical protein